jgi:hypothetical protein
MILPDEEHCLLICSHYENIRARYVGLLITKNVSREDFPRPGSVSKVEECYELPGGSSVNRDVEDYVEPLEVYPGVIWRSWPEI